MSKTKEMITLLVPRRLVDQRFDAGASELLKEAFPESPLSRTVLSRLIREGKILLNGAPAKPVTPLSFKDALSFEKDALVSREKELTPRETEEVSLLFESEAFSILEKSGKISMHPVEGRTSVSSTVAHFILSRYPEAVSIGEHTLRPGIVHRLDRETSGLFVVARTALAYQELKRVFQGRRVKKTYIALVHGHLREKKGSIASSLERVPGSLKRRIAKRDDVPGARKALTEYEVFLRYRDYDLVLVRPKTGRTHQIRVHFASLGHPVAGDTLYTSKAYREKNMLFPRQMLHAFSLEFPYLKENMSFSSFLPEDFKKALQDIDETREEGYDGEALKSLFSNQIG